MKSKSILILASALCLAAPNIPMFAQTSPAPQEKTQVKKQKTVKFTLKNTTTHAMDLKNGDEAITLQPGQSREMKVPAGTRITTASTTDSAQSGSVVTEVSDQMSGTTVNVR